MKTLYLLLSILLIFSVSSCRSTSKVTESATNKTTNVVSNEKVEDISSVTNQSVQEDSSETTILTVITEYDTDKIDEHGNSPVKRQTATLATKKKGSKKNNETQKENNISATKEESANNVTNENNLREDTKAETKQPLYYAYIIYGVAFVILMAVLAYWVFTKYRAAKPQGE